MVQCGRRQLLCQLRLRSLGLDLIEYANGDARRTVWEEELGVPMVDEHYYVDSGWMIHNQDY